MATYYVSDATGDDGDTGLTEALAWATIEKAMDTVAAGDTVYVKADGAYTETPTIDTVGTQVATITFEGYTSTPGDGGQATIDAESTRAYCLDDTLANVSAFYVVKNFIFDRPTTAGALLSVRDVIFKNCRFSNSTNTGCACDSRTMFENCLFDNNGGAGLDCTATGVVVCVGCRFDNNTGEGIETSGNIFVFYCTFAGNGADAIESLAGNSFFVVVVGCTVDGDSKTTNTGVDLGSTFWKSAILVNNIIYDCVEGVGSVGQGTFFISRNNLLNNNTTDYPGGTFQTFEGEVTSAPQFEDEAGGDYSLGSASPALNAGFDGYLQNGSTQRADIGAIESTAAGAGGGLLVHPGTSGGARA